MKYNLFKNKSWILPIALLGSLISNAQQIDIEKAPAPLYRDPVYDGVADPSIIWDDSGKQWIMYYTSRRANKTGLKGVEYCYGTAIGIATSKDNGVIWQYEGVANLPQPDKGLNTFWAPQVVYDTLKGVYHMFVTYIKGVYTDWGGERQIFRYTSKDKINWQFAEKIATTGCIDAMVFQIKNGYWKMWYKDEKRNSRIYTAISEDLTDWQLTDTEEAAGNSHEGPVVFSFKDQYWMLTDMWNGLDVYTSNDASNWEYNNTILTLKEPGRRPDDNVMGRHADVIVLKNKAYVIYFTHPGRIYKNEKEKSESTYRYRRSSLQIAELEVKEGKLNCNRDKYYLGL